MHNITDCTPHHVNIAAMIAEGAGDAYHRTERHQDHSLVFIHDVDAPIKVTRDDVDLPEELRPWAPGIRLDVQAYYADRPEPRRR